MKDAEMLGYSSDPRFPPPSQFKTHGGWLTTVTLRALARYPEHVDVAEHCLRSGTVLEVSCHPEDSDTLVGDQRRIAQAVHTVIHALGGREGEDYILRTVPLVEISISDGDSEDAEEDA